MLPSKNKDDYYYYNYYCLADEMAEPRPDMNIKVGAFTVSEKSINIIKLLGHCKGGNFNIQSGRGWAISSA